MPPKIITLNAGSSSIKLRVFTLNENMIDLIDIADAQISGIGQTVSILKASVQSEPLIERQLSDTSLDSAVASIADWLYDYVSEQPVKAFGHRVVHGGPDYFDSQAIDQHLEQALATLEPYDPEHVPATLKVIRELKRRFPDTPHVACFDTAFFRDLPRSAQASALPREYESKGIRKYGFHGLSYTYLLSELQTRYGTEIANGRVIMAHLGNGASLTAIHDSRPLDTTMSFTPSSGIMMSTRSGDLDPAISVYLQKNFEIGPDEFGKIIAEQSGLLGVSGLSADMHTLLQHQSTNSNAAEAIQLFCYHVQKAIGALSAVLGGLDTLVFSGGIGEQAPEIRERICQNLEYLGIRLSERKNTAQEAVITTHDSHVSVYVIPTNENIVIAKEVLKTISQQ